MISCFVLQNTFWIFAAYCGVESIGIIGLYKLWEDLFNQNIFLIKVEGKINRGNVQATYKGKYDGMKI